MKKAIALLLALATATAITSCAKTDIQGNPDPKDSEIQEDNMTGGIGGTQIANPVKSYSEAEEITAALGFTVRPIPESENISFSTISDNLAQVTFTFNGIAYTLRADDEDSDFSGVYTPVESERYIEISLPENKNALAHVKKLSDGNNLISWAHLDNSVYYSLYIQGNPENIDELIASAVANNSVVLKDYKEIFREPDFEWTEIRTDVMSGENTDFPYTVIIDSKEKLDEYYNANKDNFYLERVDRVYSDTTIGFLDEADKYDEAFFEENSLIFIILECGSGSIRHQVTKVESSELRTRITVKQIVPEVGTCDMAYWHIFVSIPKAEFLSDNIEIAWEK